MIEQWMSNMEFRWSDDWDLGCSHREFFGDDSAYADAEPDTCEQCCFYVNGDLVGSLGCIDDADDEYRREVERDLAWEYVASNMWRIAV